ncbi:cytochrome P450 [Aspergillus heteromorphus CBS 117.55]|uniref:Cytochrome P450 n=1 Tax=Aspergillus heteromorphus CBS 117.55 TaxID=1448321 RepID=A0A317WWY4_9EURO|nr:cytochrome P450 [Aspergillus heteromorphus CBS 117.55]PWY89842.1 cytochrome P450 [Aspergillus heteromorphus CBS 117.55]
MLSPALVLFLTCYILATAFYNIFLHPLRTIPGPPLAKVSHLWSRIGNRNGRKSERIHQAHLRYGPVLRIGPNELSFAEPAAVRDIYCSDADVEAHRQRRKLFARGFSQAAMLDFEPIISAKIDTLLEQWKTMSVNGPVDVYPWVHWLGFDVVYQLLFDEDPGQVTSGRSHEVMAYLEAWKPTYIYKELVPHLDKYWVYVPGYIGGYFRKVQAWKKYSVNLIQKSRERGTKTPFLRTVLYGENDNFLGRPLTNSELAEECMAGMFAGSGTTANSFIFLLWACLRKPNVVAKLKSELREAFPDSSVVPDYRTCSGLPYLQAVISESLRRYPVAIAILPRTAIKDTFVAGIPVQKGTTVGTQNYTIHFNEQAFPTPEEFRPERWFDTENEALRKEAWAPFSMGSRKCIGINLAQMELTKLVATFFRRFEGTVDDSITEADMRMYDAFTAAPAAQKLLVQLWETAE